MEVNFLKILFYILCFQFLFVSLFLFQNKKGKTLSNKLLAVVFLLVSLAVIDLYVTVFAVKIKVPYLLFVNDTYMFTYGPLLFLFTRSVLFKHYKLKQRALIHFIPFVIALGYVISVILFVSTDTINDFTNQVSNQDIPMYFRLGEFLILAHIFYYLIRSKLEIKKVLGKVKDLYSTFNQDNFKLLRFILNSFLALFSLSFLHALLPFIGIKNGLLITLVLMILYMFYFINAILLKLLNQSSNDSGALTQTIFKEHVKYAGSSLSDSDLQAYKEQLENYMNKNEPFLNSTLGIYDLSSELEMPSKMLSQVINEGFACNFFDFVNKYRIQAAKILLTNETDDKQTIQEVMYDSGFNSKSSFNTAFKKFTNLTPTEFKKSLQKKGSTS